jgi:virulence factor Mce-like protein
MAADSVLSTSQVTKNRWSLEALEESKLARVVLGFLLALAAVIIVVVIMASFTGHFTNVVKLDSELPTGSNAVVIGAPVEYLYVTVGKVASEGRAPDGNVGVKLDLYPSKMKEVPANVQSQVEPLSIFGNQYVALTLPVNAKSSAKPLTAGDYIPPYTAAPATSLQGSVTQIYDLLNAVHPADLDTALTAIATALNGQGTTFGQSLDEGSLYLKGIDPHLQTLNQDIQLLSPVSQAGTAATPDVLGILSNSTVTGQTITSETAQLHQLLTQGTTAVSQLTGVLDDTESSFPALINGSAPLLQDVANNPKFLAETLAGLQEWATAWAQSKGSGPYLSVNAVLPVQNISDAVDAALGYQVQSSLAGALGAAFNPTTYTSADCPQYPGESNPYCSGGSPAGAATPGASAAAVAAYVAPRNSTGATPAASTAAASTAAASASDPAGATNPFAEELQAAQSIAAALNGGNPSVSPAMATIYLMPLLTSMSGSP